MPSLQHNAHFPDNSCRFGHPLTLVLTPLVPRRARDLESLYLGSCSQAPRDLVFSFTYLSLTTFAGSKYRELKMTSHEPQGPLEDLGSSLAHL
jgi:hypothetical protein